MKGTQIYLNNLIHDPGWNFGVKAYDDFVKKVLESGYGRSVKGVVAAVFATVGRKKYERVLNQIIPQLKKEEYLADVIRVALRPHPKQISKNTTVSDLYRTPFREFNLSPELVKRYLRVFCENGEIRGVEFQAGLENIYV